MKKAFTLAEVMITLTVIGIITAVIIPVAINSKPNENIMKFKKAHNILYQTIFTLVNSDKYYLDGNLGIKPNGDHVDTNRDVNDAMYFCKTFADNVTYKKLDCHPYNNTNDTGNRSGECITDFPLSEIKTKIDTSCERAQTIDKIKAEIVFPDGVEMFQGSSKVSFGIYTKNSAIVSHGTGFEGYLFLHKSSSYQPWIDSTIVDGYRCLKLFCIDVDGFDGPEKPFSYLIRADGKIITGKRTDEWLSKSIQGDE